MARARSLAALVPVVVLLALAPAALGAKTWLAPEPHLNPNPPGQSNIYNEVVASDAAGDAVAVWQSLDPSFNEILFATTRPAGGSWAPAEQIAPPSSSTDHVSAAVDPAGNAVVAWWANSGVLYQYHAAGGAWRGASQLAGVGTDDPFVQVDRSGTVYVAYRSASGAPAVVTISDNGSHVGAAVPISPPGGQTFDVQDAPFLAVNPANGAGAVVWSARIQGTGQWVALASVKPAGGAFGAAQQISGESAGVSACDPEAALTPDGHATAVWRASGPATSNSCTTGPTGAGLNVGSATFNPVSTLWTHHPHLLGSDVFWIPPWHVNDARGWRETVGTDAGGNATALWLQQVSSGSTGTVGTATLPALGGEWSQVDTSLGSGQPLPLTDTFGFPLGANVAVNDAGDAVATWLEDNGSQRVEVARVRPAGSAAWGNRQTVSTPVTATLDTPGVAIDGFGDALTVFRLGDQNGGVIQTAAYDGAGPQLRAASIPGSVQVRAPATFSVSPFDVWSGIQGAPTWSFGDGATATGTSVQHVYATPGAFHVSVSASDRLGNATTGSGSIQVTPLPPRRKRKVIHASVRPSLETTRNLFRVRSILIKAPKGAAVTLACRKRCGHTRHLHMKRKTRRIEFPFGRAYHRAGGTLQVRITKRGFLGRYWAFKLSTSGFGRVCVITPPKGKLRRCTAVS